MANEFKVVVDHGSAGWQVRYDSPSLAGSCGPIDLTDAAVDRAVKDGAGLAQPHLLTREAAAGIGFRLFCTFFPGPIADAFHRAVVVSRSAGRGPLRLLIQYPLDSPRLHGVPWELLFDGDTGRHSGTFMALRRDVLLARSLTQQKEEHPVRVNGQIRILRTTACPPPRTPLSFSDEIQTLEQAVGRRKDRVFLATQRDASVSGLRAALTHADWHAHVWIHSGHGGVVPGPDGKPRYVLMMHGDGREEHLTDTELRQMIDRNRHLRVVVLNACESGNPLGMVPLLAELNVPAVVGYRTAVFDSTAVTFARELYEGMLTKPIDEAVRDARRGLTNTVRSLDWALPILFLRSTEPSLVEPTRGEDSFTGSYVPSPAAEVSPAAPSFAAPPVVASVAPVPQAPVAAAAPTSVSQTAKMTFTFGGSSKVKDLKATGNVAIGPNAVTSKQEADFIVQVTDGATVEGLDFTANVAVADAQAAVYEKWLSELPARPTV